MFLRTLRFSFNISWHTQRPAAPPPGAAVNTVPTLFPGHPLQILEKDQGDYSKSWPNMRRLRRLVAERLAR